MCCCSRTQKHVVDGSIKNICCRDLGENMFLLWMYVFGINNMLSDNMFLQKVSKTYVVGMSKTQLLLTGAENMFLQKVSKTHVFTLGRKHVFRFWACCQCCHVVGRQQHASHRGGGDSPHPHCRVGRTLFRRTPLVNTPKQSR